jgi:hypothetical protein
MSGGLSSRKSSKNKEKLINMLNSMPHIDANKSQLSIESWKKLKPLTLDEIIKNS